MLPDVEIFKFVAFESAVVKIHQNKATELTKEEEKAVQCILINGVENIKVTEHDGKVEASSLDEISMRRYQEQLNLSQNYMDLRFIVPSSNMCERLLSAENRAMSDFRK